MAENNKILIEPGARLNYYWDKAEEKYYVLDSGGTNYSATNYTYEEVTDEAKIKELQEKYPFGRDEIQADYNPLLNKDRGNALEVRLRRSYDEEAVDPSHIRYPYDMQVGENQDYVLFSFYDYKPPFQNRKVPSQEALNETLAQYNNTGYSSEYFKADSQVFPQIVMYMPQDIQDAFKADWQGKAFGSATASMLAAAGKTGGMNKLKQLAEAGAEQLQKAPINAAAQAITTLATSITGDSISTGDIFAGISGVVRNPNVELLFEKMNLRTFDLKFKMAPYSRNDAQSMEAIVQIFKQAMLPSYDLGSRKVFGVTGEVGAVQGGFIAVPKICSVNFMRGGGHNRHLPKYKMCAITDVKVNYTPDGTYASFQGGSPVAMELQIQFMETKLVFSEDIQDRGF